MCVTWQGSVATKRGFPQQRTFRNNPPSFFLSFIIKFCTWSLAQHSDFFCVFRVLWLHLWCDFSTVQRYINLFPVTSLPVATWSTAQASLFWFLSICEEVFFLVQKLALKRIQMELHSHKGIDTLCWQFQCKINQQK